MGPWLLLMLGCELPTVIERNCDERQAYYPDDNGDGIGEADRVYIGCDVPAGWTLVPPPLKDTDTNTDTETDTGTLKETGASSTADTSVALESHSASTGDTGDTGDTGLVDTARVETGDTGQDTAPPTGDTGSAQDLTGDTADTAPNTVRTGDTAP